MASHEFSGTLDPGRSVIWTIGDESIDDGFFRHGKRVQFDAHAVESSGGAFSYMVNNTEFSVSAIRSRLKVNNKKYAYRVTVTNHTATHAYHLKVWW